MAIQIEYFKTRKDGVVLNRAYSDIRHYIIDDSQPDVEYAEVVYPASIEKHFIESEKEIPVEPEPEN